MTGYLRQGALTAVLLTAVLFTACTPLAKPAGQPQAAQPELLVFAAASLTDALQEMGAAFSQSHGGVQVTFNFAGSQQLAQQLAGGAPADVFAAANKAQMQVAVNAGRVASETVQSFVRNRLVVVTPADNPGQVKDLADLARPGLKIVLADAAVPVGQYTRDFLAKASQSPAFTAAYSPTVLANVVSFEDNVKSVFNKIQLGEGDAGIVYSSDIGPAAAGKVKTIAVPDALNVVAVYPIAPVQDSRSRELAQQFVAYVLSPAGQKILANYGFIPVQQ